MPDQFFYQVHDANTDIYRNGSRLAGMSFSFQVDVPSRLVTLGHICVKHRNLIVPPSDQPWDAPVGVSAVIGYRTAADLTAIASVPYGTYGDYNAGCSSAQLINWISHGVDGVNVLNIEDHYASLKLESVIGLPIGAYRVEPWLFAKSDLAPDTDGLAEVVVEGSTSLGFLFGWVRAL